MPKRILKGVVISDKADKTLTVKVERRFSDPFFKKQLEAQKNTKLMMRKINLKLVISLEFKNVVQYLKPKHGLC